MAHHDNSTDGPRSPRSMRGLEVEGTEPLEHEVAEMPSISIEGQADVPAPVSPGEAVSGTATPPTGHATPNKQQKKRRVQWSIADDDGQHDHENPKRNSTAEDYFSGSHGSDNGAFTPEWSANNSSVLNTPDQSRPTSPGDHDVDIAPGETDGLPAEHSIKRFQRQAAKLIALHRAKNAFNSAAAAHRRQESAPEPSTSGGIDPNALRQALSQAGQTTTEVEEGIRPSNGLDASQPYSGTVGVLGSLLQLYTEQNKSSAAASEATLVNPPDTSLDDSRDTSPTAATFSFRRAAEGVSEAVRRPLSRFSEDNRNSRSSAGVIGTLQSSSFGLAGIASPAGSAVRPDNEKSGYRLSRFNMSSGARPASAPGSRSGSPSRKSIDSREGSRHATPPITPGSTDFLSPTGEPYGRHKKPALNMSFSNLADTFNPHNYRSESHVLRHYKSSTSMGGENTKTSYEKVVNDKAQAKSEKAQAKKERASHSAPTTPKGSGTIGTAKQALGMRKKPKKPKVDQQELFITMHVAQILARQDFILRLARALMMFGGPSHQFEPQLQATAKVLDINCQVIYLMSFMIIAFQDPDTHTSELKIIKQGAGLNIHKLKCLAILHYEVMHDKISVTDASTEISRLMTAKPTWNKYVSILLGGSCSVGIGIAAFKASFIDLLVVACMGCTLVTIQVFVASKSDVLSNCFELVMAALFSFIAAGLSSTGYFCYAAIISSSIVLLLPGWLILPAAMELQSRSIVVGSVRLVWALIYSLFLGFGISIGSVIWNAIAPSSLKLPDESSCSEAHSMSNGEPTPWWLITIPDWYDFIAVPLFAMSLAMKNQAKFRSKEFFASTGLASIGWTINHFASRDDSFSNRSDISSALAAFTVGVIANVWGRYFQSTAFVVAVTPIMLMLPSGLSNTGFLKYAVPENDSDATLTSGFNVAQQLLSITIGLVVGLFGAAIFVYPFSSKRAKGLMAF